jgi:hypothetical protein
LAYASALLNITLCSDSQCKNEPLSIVSLDEASGCRTDFAGQVLAVKVTPTDANNSDAQKARFYRSADCYGHCGSGHLIHQLSNGGAMMSSGIRDAAPLMQSFEVVNVGEDGKYEPYGYCGIRHGDAQYFRGRAWRWQQIGKDRYGDPAFREVPIEEWDDALHTRQESSDYIRHGAADSMGKIKWEQYAEGKWGGIPLELWDENIHLRNDKPYDIGVLDQQLVESVRKRLTKQREAKKARSDLYEHGAYDAPGVHLLLSRPFLTYEIP